jgi:tetratricopeptide (TPR) repeat protein
MQEKCGRLMLALVALAIMGAVPARAADHWMKAEDSRFILYGRQSEQELRGIIANLEVYDATLRVVTGFRSNPDPKSPKLSIFLLRSTKEFVEAIPQVTVNHGGVYTQTPELVCALAIFSEQPDATGVGGLQVIFHEYAHYFMSQHSRMVYPTWYIEGFAEFFMTTVLKDDGAEIGNIAGWRVSDLAKEKWLPFSKVLFSSVGELNGTEVFAFYAESWLLTHYLMMDPERRNQLNQYITVLNQGVEPQDAFRQVFAMEPNALEPLLRDYQNHMQHSSVPLPAVESDAPPVISELPGAYDELLLLDVRLKTGVPFALRDTTLAQIRGNAGDYPDSAFAQRVLARGEIYLGLPENGLAMAKNALAAMPGDPDWLYLKGLALLVQAEQRPADRAALVRQGRAALAQAIKVRPDDVATLFQYGSSFFGDPGEPSEKTVSILHRALDLSPQVAVIRIRTAYALMVRGQFDEAARILKTVTYDPHGGGYARYAGALLAYAEKRKPPDAEVSRTVAQ